MYSNLLMLGFMKCWMSDWSLIWGNVELIIGLYDFHNQNDLISIYFSNKEKELCMLILTSSALL